MSGTETKKLVRKRGAIYKKDHEGFGFIRDAEDPLRTYFFHSDSLPIGTNFASVVLGQLVEFSVVDRSDLREKTGKATVKDKAIKIAFLKQLMSAA